MEIECLFEDMLCDEPTKEQKETKELQEQIIKLKEENDRWYKEYQKANENNAKSSKEAIKLVIENKKLEDIIKKQDLEIQRLQNKQNDILAYLNSELEYDEPTLVKFQIQKLVDMLEDSIYTCMECGKEFEKPQEELCPYCGSGDITK